MLRLKDNDVFRCIFLVCMDKSERALWENVLINIRTISAIYLLFSQNVAHLFVEFGLFDFLVARKLATWLKQQHTTTTTTGLRIHFED